jgi:hypothetical protein
MLRRAAIQPKLLVGPVDDPLEHEADRIADQVMRMPDPKLSIAAAPRQRSRKCAACEEEAQTLQSRIAGSPEAAGGEAPSIVHEVLRSPGQPLDAPSRAFFEPRFGRDFSHVRVHTDERAGASAHVLGALAYTVGRHIGFPAGAFAPRSHSGCRLIAHELAHTLQSRVPVRTIQRQEANDSQGGGSDPGAQPSDPTTTITLPETTIVATPPASLRSQIGTLYYYEQRAYDFAYRNPGKIPPDYYFFYGEKYVNRFKTALRPNLSPAGQAWVDCTLVALQTAIEDRRDANPWGFAELELDNEAFRAFAFETHPNVYVSCGVCDLSIIDEAKIAITPDFKDILTLGGVQQIVDTFLECTVVWFYPHGPAM